MLCTNIICISVSGCGSYLKADEPHGVPVVRCGDVLLRFPESGQDGGDEPEARGAMGGTPPMAQHVCAKGRGADLNFF